MVLLHKRNLAKSLAVLAGVALVGVAVETTWHFAGRLPKRFAPVEAGQLYRSGEVTPAQLETLRDEYHIKTVLSLLNPDAPESVSERAAAQRLGIEWLNVPLRGNGASTAADRDRIRAMLEEPRDAPLLVHCAAGTNRTGLAIGMYRLHHDGWPLSRVLAEMKEYDFEDGPNHEDLRQALAAEAELARKSRPDDDEPQPSIPSGPDGQHP